MYPLMLQSWGALFLIPPPPLLVVAEVILWIRLHLVEGPATRRRAVRLLVLVNQEEFTGTLA